MINNRFKRTNIYGFFKRYKKFSVTTIVLFFMGSSAFMGDISNIVGLFQHEKPQVSIFDIQYELADENGSVIHRRTWQGNELLDTDAANISRMILSIKLRNPSNSRVFAEVKNEEEIYDKAYVLASRGAFQHERYPIPANGDTGFIFGVDITPFTQVTFLSSSATNTQSIKIFDEQGNYLGETSGTGILKTYGIRIPYEIEIFNDKDKLVDSLAFKVECRASVAEAKAVINDDTQGIDGKITRSLGFECHPTF